MNIPMDIDELRGLIREVPDFPKEGILFKDITPLLGHAHGFQSAIHTLAAQVADESFDLIVAPEARGFIFGCALAHELGKGFAPIRKPGKLPYETSAVTYDLEYGQDTVQIHRDAIQPGQRVLLVDDVLASGGTMAACAQLVENHGGVVGRCLFFLELTFLEGRSRLKDYTISALIAD